MTKRMFIAGAISVALLSLATFAREQSMGEPAKAPNAKELGQQAEEAFKLQSYNQAITKAQAYLKTNPPAADARRVEKLIGLSQIRLNQFGPGLKTLQDLLKKDPAYERDAETLEAIAAAHMAARSNQPLEAAKWIDKAIVQYAADKNDRKQLDLLFRLAEFLRQHVYNVPSGDEQSQYPANIVRAVALMLDAYDRALAVGGSMADQVRALAGKAEAVRQFSTVLNQLAREKYPASIQTKYDLSKPVPLIIEFEREIVKRFPNSTDAAAALLRIGQTQEHHDADFLAALKSYAEVIERFPRSNEARQATAAIANIKGPQLSLQIEGISLPGEKPKFQWSARNLQNIELVAYPVDLFDVLKKVEQLHEIYKYPTSKLQAVDRWKIETGDNKDHKHLSNGDKPAEAPLDKSNAYLVVASGSNPEGKSVKAHALFIVSRLGLMAKTAQQKNVLFTMDAITGKPLAKTELLVQRLTNQVVVPILNVTKNVYAYDRRTAGDSGLTEIPLPAEKENQQFDRSMMVLARQGTDYAVSDAHRYYYGYWWNAQAGYYSYGYTDRPVYRPQQTVQFKHILRSYEGGTYHNTANQKIRVLINDARGNSVYDKELIADEFGSLSGSLTLGATPTLGMYRMSVSIPNVNINVGPGSSFRVEEYKKPEYEVTITPDRPTYKIGERLKAKVHGEYYFGGAVANADVQYTVHRLTYYHNPVWPRPFAWFFEGDEMSGGMPGMAMRRGGFYPYPHQQRQDLVASGTLKTDEFGNATIDFETKPFEQTPNVDLQYRIEARMVDQSRREIQASQSIKVTHQAFYVSLKPQKSLYQPGDRIRITAKGESPNGAPVAFEGKTVVSLVTQREERDDSGKIKQRETLEQMSQKSLTVDADGEADFTFDAEKAGYYRIDVTAPDPYGATITGTAYVWVAKGPGQFAHYANRDLELVLDNDTFEAGQTLRLLLNSKHKDAYVLLTAEADDLYMSRVVYVEGNSTTVDVPIERSFRPNVTLKAALFRDNQIFSEERAIKVPPIEEFLTVKIKAPKQEFQPREVAEVEVEVVNHKGQPVATQLSLGVVDASIFYIQSETRGDIRKFFYGRQRPLMVQTTSSYAFRFWAQGRDQMNFRFKGGDRAAEGMMGGAMPGASHMRDDVQYAPAAPSMARAPMPKEAAKQEGAAMVEPQVRSEFPDTVFWAAHLTTSADGKVKATIRFPDSLTTWRLTAIGATKETAVGEIQHEVQTKKNVIVRLQAPRFFVEKDQVTLSAIAHNYLDKPKTVRVSLEVSSELTLLAVGEEGQDKTGPGSAQREIDITVPPGGEKRVDFLASVLRPGKVNILAKALTDTESDAMKMEYPVLEYGAEKLLAESGILFGRAETPDEVSVRLAIPEAVRAGSQRMMVKVSPTIAGVMLESLPYLLQYPYGCTEQTMSRFLPAVLTSHTLRKLGMELSELKKISGQDPVIAKRLDQFHSPVYDRAEMDKMIAAGLTRLADFQKPDGGWGWWKNDQSNPYISAYVVSGLAVAAESGVKLPEGMLSRGVTFLVNQVGRSEPINQFPWQKAENTSVRVYMLYAIGQADAKMLGDPKVSARIQESFRLRDDLNDYSRALLALALNRARLNEQADIVLANIKDRARIDEQSQTASWGDYDGYYYWYQSGTEATSYSLKALLAIEPQSPMVPQVVNWLVRHRKGTRWFNTKDTATVCYALADYLQMTRELDPDLTITVDINGSSSKTFRVTKENLFTFDDEFALAAEALGVGDKQVTIRRQGRGNVYWGAYATFFSKEEQITEGGNELFVSRKYERLIPHEVEKSRKVFDPKTRKQVDENYREIEYERKPLAEGDQLQSGDLIEVGLTVTAKNNFEYLVFEDPKPAGCEAIELRSGYAWGGGLGAHMELRDTKVAFFATYLNQGKHQINYRLRAEIPGTFHALPSQAECMYTPLVKGNGASHIIRIVDVPAK